MRKLFSLFFVLLLLSCSSTKETTKVNTASKNTDLPEHYAKTITAKDLGNHLYTFASDEFEGRNTGEAGQKKAVKYISDFYVKEGIKSALDGTNYFQPVPAEYINHQVRRGNFKDSENVLGFIKGTEKPEEVLILSAHRDHMGVQNGKIYNGADDDGSGSVAILEIAQAFREAVKEGNGPKRSILFLHVTGEERGLIGSKYYTENPIFPLANTVANLNIDMVGRVDERHKRNPYYIYLIGSDKLSTELHNLSENVNNKYTKLDLDYKYNDDKDPNRFYYRSDHYNFAKHNIPIIFYFNGTHNDYHQETDTPEKINYEALEARSRLVFLTAWEIANRSERLTVDKATKK